MLILEIKGISGVRVRDGVLHFGTASVLDALVLDFARTERARKRTTAAFTLNVRDVDIQATWPGNATVEALGLNAKNGRAAQEHERGDNGGELHP
jgi:hypothetical protein